MDMDEIKEKLEKAGELPPGHPGRRVPIALAIEDIADETMVACVRLTGLGMSTDEVKDDGGKPDAILIQSSYQGSRTMTTIAARPEDFLQFLGSLIESGSALWPAEVKKFLARAWFDSARTKPAVVEGGDQS